MPEAGFILGITLGVVLAGGKSSRMGSNKALLKYKGKPLVEHMLALLHQSGIANTVISGEVNGYPAVEDAAAFSGPAAAMLHMMRRYTDVDHFLFLPVDMPLLTPALLACLLSKENGAYFADSPLPAFVVRHGADLPAMAQSVGHLLQVLNIPSIPLPTEFEEEFCNINTPQEWQEVARS